VHSTLQLAFWLIAWLTEAAETLNCALQKNQIIAGGRTLRNTRVYSPTAAGQCLYHYYHLTPGKISPPFFIEQHSVKTEVFQAVGFDTRL
jgi:hypothetical protein